MLLFLSQPPFATPDFTAPGAAKKLEPSVTLVLRYPLHRRRVPQSPSFRFDPSVICGQLVLPAHRLNKTVTFWE